MATEVEAKFLAAGTAPLRRLAARHRLGHAALGEPETFDEIDRYLDTVDGRLAARRWACRLRYRHGQWRVSLKGPAVSDGKVPPAWMHARSETEGPALDRLDLASWPASAAREQLAGMSGGATLVERLRLLQRRTERSVTMGGRRLATLSLDEVHVERDGRPGGSFFVVELELADGADQDALPGFAGILRDMPGLVADPRSKLEHALGMLGEGHATHG